MDSMMIVRAVLGVLLIVAAGASPCARAWFLLPLIRSGQPAVGRTDQVPARVETQFTEVLGQRKLLKWSVPGMAHVFVFFGFLVLFLTVIEAFGELFWESFAFPIIGTWPTVRAWRTCSRSWSSSASWFRRDPAARAAREAKAGARASSARTRRAPGSCSG